MTIKTLKSINCENIRSKFSVNNLALLFVLILMNEIMDKQSWPTKFWFDKLWTKWYEMLVELLENTLRPSIGLKIINKKGRITRRLKTFTYLRCYFQICQWKVVYLRKGDDPHSMKLWERWCSNVSLFREVTSQLVTFSEVKS